MKPPESLHKMLWLWIPVCVFLAKLAGENFLYEGHVAWIVSENGPYEIVQFCILVIAFVIALYTLIGMDRSNRWMAFWIALAALCCLYVAGEEVSWGQHFLKWSTPEYWQGVNDQGETNFHNTSSWLDQKPRLLLSIGVYVGGIIIPLLLMFKPSSLPQQFLAIYPTREFIITAAICLFIKIVDKIGEASGSHLLGRNAESEEMFLFYFVLLYLLLMKKRLIPATKGA